MRIVGGAFRGRSLLTPASDRIRPTTDRTRESLFNIIEHGIGHDLVGARALDLFSGTGALGLEAMSRGATFCLFVEEGAEGRGLIRGNVEAFGLTGATRIFRRDATRLGPAGGQGVFDLLFADPPYGKSLGDAALASALAGGWLAPSALCVLEEAASASVATPDGFALEDTRAMGDTVLRFFRAPSS